MCGDWGMCKSNYLLTAVAEREGWEWHRGSSRRWAPSICHSTPQPPPHPPPAFILSLCLSLVLSFSLSLYLSLSVSLDLSWYMSSVVHHSVWYVSFHDKLYWSYSFKCLCAASVTNRKCKNYYIGATIGWTNRLQTYTIGWVSVKESEQKHHSVYCFS